MLAVVALGGHALADARGRTRPGDQVDAARRAMTGCADLLAAGVRLVLTHGNGPQVGDLLQLTLDAGSEAPLDWCVAQTQGSIGMVLADALDGELRRRGLPGGAVALLTRTLVAGDDPALSRPSKPVGSHGAERLVGSPEPLEILEASAVRTLVAAGHVVVAAGGGGIPVVRRADGTLEGIEAVVDKDLSAAVLARVVGADVLVIATDVPHAATDFGTDRQRPIHRVGVTEMEALAAAGHFAEGSMGPKVEAMCRFVRAGGSRAVVTDLGSLGRSLGLDGADDEVVGTVVVPDP